MAQNTAESLRRAVILAGGAGSRLKPLTNTVPKPLVEFATEPFMLGVLRRLADAGVTHVWILIGVDTTPFRAVVERARALGVDVTIVTETRPLGTAGGVRRLAQSWNEPFLVLNGDILTDVDVHALAAAHASSVATLVVSRVDDPSAYGVCQVENGSIVGFLEKPSPDVCQGPALVNAGTYVVSPALLQGFPDGELSFERDVFPEAIRRGQQLKVCVTDAHWADLGTPERFRAGHRLVLDGTIRWPGVTRVPETVPGVRVAPTATIAQTAQLIAPVLIGDGVVVASGATVGPYVVLGSGVTVGNDARLDDVLVQSGAKVGARAVLRHTIVGPDVQLGDDVSAVDDCVLVTDVASGSLVPPGFRGGV